MVIAYLFGSIILCTGIVMLIMGLITGSILALVFATAIFLMVFALIIVALTPPVG